MFPLKARSVRRSKCSRRAAIGFSLIEMGVTLAIVAISASVAVPAYSNYRVRVRNADAVRDIATMGATIENFMRDNRVPPASLAEVGLAGRLDPWGKPYRYYNIVTGNKSGARKNKNLVPINSDFDLYSEGPDGQTVAPLTAKFSQDDIVRANNGTFIGVAADY
jgi:general secretion pathway protein G